MWTVWGERNRLTFIDVKSMGVKLLVTVTGSLHEWCHVWGSTVCDSIVLLYCAFGISLFSFFLIIFC